MGLALDVVLLLPELTIAGSLIAPAKVVDMLTASGIDPAGVPDTLTISVADFSADATNGHYSVDVAVDGIWPSPPLKLEQITAGVRYDRSQGFTGFFGAQIGIASTTIDLFAEYAGQADGWVFSGAMDPSSTIAIGDLLTELAGSFGITAIPEPVRSLELTGLALSYKTGSGEFAFACEAGFTVEPSPPPPAPAATQVAVTVTITVAPTAQVPVAAGADPPAAVVKGSKGYSATFTGQVAFAGQQFDLVFDVADAGTDVLVADYLHAGAHPVELRALVAGVSAELAQAIPAGISVGLEEIKFVFLKQADAWWAFGLRLGVSINLNQLPVFGPGLPPDLTLSVENLQLLYAKANLGPPQTVLINGLLPPGVAKLPDPVGQGIAFDADIRLGETTKHLHAGITPPPAVAPPGSPPPAAGPAGGGPPAAAGSGPAQIPASSANPVKWLDVNRQFAVFSLARIGAGYRDNVLLFAVDASVAVGPLAFSLQALSVGSPLDKFEPVFSLAGMALDFSRPPITIAGAFLRVTETVNGKTVTAFYGELIAGIGELALKAVGGWVPETGSFFLYAAVDVPLGGTPFLFITGLAGGFGINYSLTLPSVDEAGSFVLLPGPTAPKVEAPAQTIKNLVTALGQRIIPMPGEYWIAAGIEFTSFEMIQSQVVVSVEFGVEVQIGVVGVVTMTFPTGAGDAAIAHVEVDIVASFTPSTGLLAIDGKLSPESFLLGGFVKLTGGFAVRAWFSGPHQGDFVISLGGYHPAFDWSTAGYPAVPRLGLSFTVGPLKVIGESYFALTPHAFMAGLRLSATFEAGPIKVWFDAGIDFLLEWAPFHYEAGAYVDFGCSIDLGLFTLTIHIGARLQIWGPEFGGTAAINLVIVTFTIPFGAPKAPPPPIGWDALAAKFLPGPSPAQDSAPAPAVRAAAATPAGTTNVVRADVKDGKLKAEVTGPDGALDWVVDPDHFQIVTTSMVPANHADWISGQDANGQDIVTELREDLTFYHQGLPADSAPGTAAPAAGPAPVGLEHLYLWVEAGRPATGPAWAQDLHVAPMDQADVAAHHVVELYRLAEGARDYDTNLAVRPVVTASNTAIWGSPRSGGQQDQDVNAGLLIPDTLTGLEISPRPQHPDQVQQRPAGRPALRAREPRLVRLRGAPRPRSRLHGYRPAPRPGQPADHRHRPRRPGREPGQRRLPARLADRPLGQHPARRRA